MEFALIIFRQTLLMSLYMLIGYLLYRGKKVDVAGSRSIAAMLVWVVIPATIIKSCLVPYSSQRLLQMGQCFLLAAAVLGFAMLVARLCFRRDAVAQFSAAFSNAGFIGIPLVQASLGDEAVFYLIGILILLNLLQWTYGAGLLKGERVRLSARNILLNPVMIAAIIGIGLFASGLGSALPDFCTGMISGVAALNAPLAMIVLGIYLARTKIGALFTTKRLYLVSAVRLLVIPLATVLVFKLFPVSTPIRMTMLIAGAAPVGANVAVYSQLYDTDYGYACQTVTQSTLFSIITMPVIIWIAERLF